MTTDPLQPANLGPDVLDADRLRAPRDLGLGEPPAPRRHRATVAVSVLLVLALALAGYLWTTARGYQHLAASTEGQARVIGSDLTQTRTDLAGATAELAGVRTQLAAAEARITALAAEKAQLGDDREAQRQLVDYQQRVSKAAGTVASALDRCIQSQNELIGYLNNAAAYASADLVAFGSQVTGLCKSATDANKALQTELAR